MYLEGDLGYTLCFHERDFLVGESIPANIEAAINHSRRMIMIISRWGVLITFGLVLVFIKGSNKMFYQVSSSFLSGILWQLVGF